MKMHLEGSGGRLITDYGPGRICVDGTALEGSVFIAPQGVTQHWFDGDDISSLSREHFGDLLTHKPEILILGSGENHHFPPAQLMQQLAGEGMSLEVMNTRAACRTYNVLISEMRDVSAALLGLPTETSRT